MHVQHTLSATTYHATILCSFICRSYVGPLQSWTAQVLPTLDENEPVHGDLHTVDTLLEEHEVGLPRVHSSYSPVALVSCSTTCKLSSI